MEFFLFEYVHFCSPYYHKTFLYLPTLKIQDFS